MKKTKIRFTRKKIVLLSLCTILTIGLIIPQNLVNPVLGAGKQDYNSDSFWYYPWGKSVTHKGVDIFAKKGTEVQSATNGLILFAGDIPIGGNVILTLGPKWRIHYYAHLEAFNCSSLSYVSKGEKIATVGDSGNAKGKPAHLHYSIISLIPYPWRIDDSRQGWKKMFYLNPMEYLEE